MRVDRLQVAIGCVLISTAWVAWSLWTSQEGGSLAPVGQNGQSPGGSATVAATEATPSQALRSTAATGGNATGSAVTVTNAARQLSLEELIALQTNRELLPSRVARFDAVTESELIHRYQTSQSAREKNDLARLMAYGGGTSSVAFFTNALFHEFVGKPLDDPWEPILISALPMYLGILASREDTALHFLLSGVQGQLDLRQPAWETGEYRLEEKVLRGSFWKGLGWSGRREARQLLNEVLAGQRLELVKDVDSEVVDAAFYLRVVESHGLDERVRLSRDLDRRLNEHRQWLQSTEEGRAWDEWWHAHSPDVRPGTRPSANRQR